MKDISGTTTIPAVALRAAEATRAVDGRLQCKRIRPERQAPVAPGGIARTSKEGRGAEATRTTAGAHLKRSENARSGAADAPSEKSTES